MDTTQLLLLFSGLAVTLLVVYVRCRNSAPIVAQVRRQERSVTEDALLAWTVIKNSPFSVALNFMLPPQIDSPGRESRKDEFMEIAKQAPRVGMSVAAPSSVIERGVSLLSVRRKLKETFLARLPAGTDFLTAKSGIQKAVGVNAKKQFEAVADVVHPNPARLMASGRQVLSTGLAAIAAVDQMLARHYTDKAVRAVNSKLDSLVDDLKNDDIAELRGVYERLYERAPDVIASILGYGTYEAPLDIRSRASALFHKFVGQAEGALARIPQGKSWRRRTTDRKIYTDLKDLVFPQLRCALLSLFVDYADALVLRQNEQFQRSLPEKLGRLHTALGQIRSKTRWMRSDELLPLNQLAALEEWLSLFTPLLSDRRELPELPAAAAHPGVCAASSEPITVCAQLTRSTECDHVAS